MIESFVFQEVVIMRAVEKIGLTREAFKAMYEEYGDFDK